MTPEGWRRTNLRQLANESSRRNDGSWGFDDLMGVTNTDGLVPMRKRVQGKDVDRCKVVTPGAFAYNPMRINVGSIACNSSPRTVIVSPDYIVFECVSDQLDFMYFDYIRQSGRWQTFVKGTGKGSVRIRIYFSQLSEYEFDVPPVKEQKKIAAILGSVDEAIQATQAVIDQTRKIKQGLLQQLLTRGIGHTRFKKTEIGEIPEEWGVAPLGRCFDNLDNMRVPVKESDRKEMRGDVPYYGASGIIDWVQRPLFNECLLLLAEDGANLLTRSLPIAFKVEGPSFVNNHAHVYRPGGVLEIDLAVEVLCQMNLTPYVTGSAQPKLNKAQSDSILMPIPPLAEQKEIVSLLASTNQTIIENTGAHQQLLEIKRGLMQDLLTGRVRVKGVA